MKFSRYFVVAALILGLAYSEESKPPAAEIEPKVEAEVKEDEKLPEPEIPTKVEEAKPAPAEPIFDKTTEEILSEPELVASN